MSERDRRATVLDLLGGSEELLAGLRDAGLVPEDDESLGPEHAETARVVYVLVQELGVNWEGVEIIVRLRGELVATRRQVADLLAFLRRERKTP